MKYKELSIKGCFLVFTKKHEDSRGSFLRVYDERVFKKIISTKKGKNGGGGFCNA
jgi:dTDP-4-dehydrorhamnose 3,5-epimerase-like enzyme